MLYVHLVIKKKKMLLFSHCLSPILSQLSATSGNRNHSDTISCGESLNFNISGENQKKLVINRLTFSPTLNSPLIYFKTIHLSFISVKKACFCWEFAPSIQESLQNLTDTSHLKGRHVQIPTHDKKKEISTKILGSIWCKLLT